MVAFQTKMLSSCTGAADAPWSRISQIRKKMGNAKFDTDSPAESIFISLKSESSRSCAEFMPNKFKRIKMQS